MYRMSTEHFSEIDSVCYANDLRIYLKNRRKVEAEKKYFEQNICDNLN